jgi:general secretion pathway protein L
MKSELKELFAAWIAGVAAAIDLVVAPILRRRRILLVEEEVDKFTARIISANPGQTLPEVSFGFLHGRAEPPLTADWSAALRDSRIDILMRPDRVLFRPIEFPRQAADFLDGMIRAQIDRLTPWAANDALFGLTPPLAVGNERIAFTLAATSQGNIQPLLKLGADLGASSVVGLVEVPEAGQGAEPIKLFERQLDAAVRTAFDVPKLLRVGLLGAGIAAAASLVLSAYVGGILNTQQQELQQRIAQRRVALRINQTSGSRETELAKRKQTTPATVIALEAISSVLPDTTYVTELRIEGDKMQVVGVTQDAPSLIKLIEQSPQFTRATFFAPTTRAQNDPGERFHIEAHVTPFFGSGS